MIKTREDLFKVLDEKKKWIYLIEVTRILLKTWNSFAFLFMLILFPLYAILSFYELFETSIMNGYTIFIGSLLVITIAVFLNVMIIGKLYPQNDIKTPNQLHLAVIIFIISYLNEVNKNIKKINDGTKQNQRMILINKSIKQIKNSTDFLTTEIQITGIPLGFRFFPIFETRNVFVNKKIKERIRGLIIQLNELSFKLIAGNQNDYSSVSKELEDIINNLINLDLSNFKELEEPKNRFVIFKEALEWIRMPRIISVLIAGYLLKFFGLI